MLSLYKLKTIMSKRIVLVCVGLAIGVVIYLATSSLDPIRWKEGDAQSYHIEVKSDVKSLDFASGAPSYAQSEVYGILNMVIRSVNTDSVVVDFHLQPERVSINNESDERFNRLYNRPFQVVYSKKGEILDFLFSGRLPREDRKYLKSIMYYIQYVQFSGRKWKVEESDLTAKYLSRYRKTSQGVAKSRSSISLHQTSEMYADALQMIQSDFAFTFDEEWSWVSGVVIREKWRMTGKKLDSTTTMHVSLKKKEKGLDADSVLAKGVNYYEEPVAGQLSVFEEMQLDEVKPSIKQGDYKRFIALFKSGDMTDREFVKNMSDYLKLFPEDSEKIGKMILGGTVDNRAGNLILYTMSNAGFPECQRVLLSVASHDAVSQSLRLQASVYLGDVKNPDLDVVRSLRYFDYNYSDGDLSNASSAMINSLGRMASKIDSESVVHEEINSILKEKIDQSWDASSAEKVSLVSALSNTRNSVYIEDIDRFRNDDQMHVRLAALDAYEYYEGETVDNAIIDSLLHDSDPLVRREAAIIQKSRGYNKQFVDNLKDAFYNEEVGYVRFAMVNYLHEYRLSDSSIKPFLEEALEHEDDSDVRRRMLQAIHAVD